MAKILAFCGSLRKDSFNKRLANIALKGAEEAGAEITFLDLNDYPLPLYNQDVQDQGFPENATKIKDLLKSHDGFLIASPEYNSGYSAALKNLIDWASRPIEGEKKLEAFSNKVIAIMATSPGALGGLRGLPTIRNILTNLHCIVIPDQVAVGNAFEAFDQNGQLKDPAMQDRVKNLGRKVVDISEKLNK